MKALVYHGPRQVSVDDVPDARIEKPDRRPGPHHVHEHLRLGPAHVRGAHRLRGGPDLRSREPRRGRGGRRRRRQGRGRGHGLRAVQRQLRALRELRARPDQLLPARQRAGDGRCRLRVRRHGSLARRAGRVPARPVGRLPVPAPARGRPRQAGRLRHALGHLPHRLARGGDVRAEAGGEHRHLRRRPRRADGRALGRHPGRRAGDGRRPPPRPAPAGRADRRDRDRRLAGLAGRPGDGADQGPGRGPRMRVRGLPGARSAGERGQRRHPQQVGVLGAVHRRHRHRRACSSRRTPAPPTSWPSRARPASTSATSGSRASRWAAGRPRSSATTATCAA